MSGEKATGAPTAGPVVVTGRTRLYTVLAHPADHVRTPELFNAAYRAAGIDLATVAIDVAPEDLATVVSALRRWRNLAGTGVTVPHKEAIIPLLDWLGPQATLVGAVNCVRREADGSLIGEAFDGIAMTAALRAGGVELAGARVLLLGAGGTARAIAFALADEGARTLTIANRTPARAQQLADAIGAVAPDCEVRLGEAVTAGNDVVVNATVLGMHDGDDSPLELSTLTPDTAVADVVMVDGGTPLLRAASELGCTVIAGERMLTAQVCSNLAWVGVELDPAEAGSRS